MSKKERTKSKDEAGVAGGTDEEGGHTVPADSAAAVATKRRAHLHRFAVTMIVAWGLGTCAYIYSYPHLLYNALERAIVQHGLGATASGGGSSGIPVNTLYAMSELASPPTLKSNLLEGTNHDTLYTIGCLDLSKGPEVLHVPDMADRYYSIEFVGPWGDVFAYVGRRTTGTRAGDYLINGPDSRGKLPEGVTRIVSPNDTVLLIGRVLVESDSDLTVACELEKQIRLTPLSRWQPGR